MQKYLLYIDILGFSNLVKQGIKHVYGLYSILDDLNVHRHEGFETIVFSDTILVYNRFDTKELHDHHYAVMFMCEFAQDLMYRIFPLDIFFRALLVHGDFTHYALKNVECFFGEALITAYNSEKRIPGIGLYTDKTCSRRSTVFCTESFSSDLDFVYLNQRLHDLEFRILPEHPHLSRYHLHDEILAPEVVREAAILSKIHHNMLKHPDPVVRCKFLTTWHYLHQKYSTITTLLARKGFSPQELNREFDWSTYIDQYKGHIAEQSAALERSSAGAVPRRY